MKILILKADVFILSGAVFFSSEAGVCLGAPEKCPKASLQQGIPKHKTVGWVCFKVWFCSWYVGKLLLKLEEVVFAWFCVELCGYHSSRTRWWFEKKNIHLHLGK